MDNRETHPTWLNVKNIAKCNIIILSTVLTLSLLALSVLILLACAVTWLSNSPQILGSYWQNLSIALLLFSMATGASWLTESLTKRWL